MRIMRIKTPMKDSDKIIKALIEAGWVTVHTRGDHQKWKSPDGRTTIVTHPVKDIPVGTRKAIERQTGLKIF